MSLWDVDKGTIGAFFVSAGGYATIESVREIYHTAYTARLRCICTTIWARRLQPSCGRIVAAEDLVVWRLMVVVI